MVATEGVEKALDQAKMRRYVNKNETTENI